MNVLRAARQIMPLMRSPNEESGKKFWRAFCLPSVSYPEGLNRVARFTLEFIKSRRGEFYKFQGEVGEFF